MTSSGIMEVADVRKFFKEVNSRLKPADSEIEQVMDDVAAALLELMRDAEEIDAGADVNRNSSFDNFSASAANVPPRGQLNAAQRSTGAKDVKVRRRLWFDGFMISA